MTLYLDGWSVTAIAGYLATSRQTVHEALRRWDAEGWPGLADRPLGRRQPARKVDLRAMAAIRRLQANPELGEFRIHAALAQRGIHLSPRTCGRILALHRALGAPRPAAAVPHEAWPMPFAALRRHQYWSVDVRYLEDHGLGTDRPVYVISILEYFSRALLASAVSPRQDLTAYLIVLRAAVEAHGAPEVLVSDGGGIFRATHARAIYAALGIEKREVDAGQAWQNYIETHFNVMRRLADHDIARATTWADLQAAHGRFFHNYNHQAHLAHRERSDGRHSPAVVLGWVQGAWCDPADLDRLFRLRATRRLNVHGALRFRHWQLYGERGLAGARVAVWVWDETLTIEHAAETLAQYPVPGCLQGRRASPAGGRRTPAVRHRPRVAPAVPAALGRDRMAPGAAVGALPAAPPASSGPVAGAAVRGRGARRRRVNRARGTAGDWSSQVPPAPRAHRSRRRPSMLLLCVNHSLARAGATEPPRTSARNSGPMRLDAASVSAHRGRVWPTRCEIIGSRRSCVRMSAFPVDGCTTGCMLGPRSRSPHPVHPRR